MPETRTITFYVGVDGTRHIRVDAPGIAAVSAPITDPLEWVADAAFELGLNVDDTNPATLVISVAPGS